MMLVDARTRRGNGRSPVRASCREQRLARIGLVGIAARAIRLDDVVGISPHLDEPAGVRAPAVDCGGRSGSIVVARPAGCRDPGARRKALGHSETACNRWAGSRCAHDGRRVGGRSGRARRDAIHNRSRLRPLQRAGVDEPPLTFHFNFPLSTFYSIYKPPHLVLEHIERHGSQVEAPHCGRRGRKIDPSTPLRAIAQLENPELADHVRAGLTGLTTYARPRWPRCRSQSPARASNASREGPCRRRGAGRANSSLSSWPSSPSDRLRTIRLRRELLRVQRPPSVIAEIPPNRRALSELRKLGVLDRQRELEVMARHGLVIHERAQARTSSSGRGAAASGRLPGRDPSSGGAYRLLRRSPSGTADMAAR